MYISFRKCKHLSTWEELVHLNSNPHQIGLFDFSDSKHSQGILKSWGYNANLNLLLHHLSPCLLSMYFSFNCPLSVEVRKWGARGATKIMKALGAYDVPSKFGTWNNSSYCPLTKTNNKTTRIQVDVSTTYIIVQLSL